MTGQVGGEDLVAASPSLPGLLWACTLMIGQTGGEELVARLLTAERRSRVENKKFEKVGHFSSS